jgi:nicotinamide-nucleotide amidase
MITDPELHELAARVGHKLLTAERRLVSAESCTGGWIAKTLTDIPGSSRWFECGYVTYSNVAKMRDLGVAVHTLERFGAVSEQTAREMALGALRVSGASVALAVTGIAGPDGGAPDKPVGTVWICAAAGPEAAQHSVVEEKLFAGDRAFVRRCSVLHALRLVLGLDLSARLQGTPRAHPP